MAGSPYRAPSPTNAPPAAHDHAGGPAAADGVWFIPPPPEVGEVLSCETTLRSTSAVASRGTYLRRLAVGLAVCAAPITGLALAQGGVDGMLEIGLLTLGIGGLVGAVIRHAHMAEHFVSYLGDRGFALYQRELLTGRTTTRALMRWDDAAELRVTLIDRVVQHGMRSHVFQYAWTDARGAARAVLEGEAGTQRMDPDGPVITFAEHAEQAWTRHLLPLAEKALEAQGALQFKLRDGRVLRVRPGRCEAVHTDQTLTWEADRGDHFTLYSGMVDLVSAERGQGYSFPYGDLANAQHFIAALSAVAGLPAR